MEMSAHTALAIAIVALALSAGYHTDLENLLFGDILALSDTDTWYTGILGVVALGVIAVMRHAVLRTSLSEELAQSVGTDTSRVHIIYMLTLALAVALGVKALGVILVGAYLVLPANTAKLLAWNMTSLFALSAGIALAGTLGGLGLAYTLDTPAGATIVLVLGVFLGGTVILRSILGLRLR